MKVLIIRFSSIGDLTQALSIPSFIRYYHPEAEIHFVTRQDLSSLLDHHPALTKIWTLDRKSGARGLFKLILTLRDEKFTHIYDAHNNLRSFLIRSFVGAPNQLVKPMMRIKRFLLVRFQKNFFEKPFSGQRDLIKPLKKWNMSFFLPPPPQLFIQPDQMIKVQQRLQAERIQDFIVLAPSAAYPLKRWPLKHWFQLIQLNPAHQFVVLAGPHDDFTAQLSTLPNVHNFTGQTTLLESAAMIQEARAVISNDTGLLHFAEQLGRPSIALMGPAPFGFPSRPSTRILERDLWCRPCSKHGQGPCVNPNFQECLQDISPSEVSLTLRTLLAEGHS